MNVIYNIIRYKTTTWTGYERYFQHHTLQNSNMNRLWTLFTTSYVTKQQHEQAINVIFNIIRYKTATWTGYKRYFQHHTLQNSNLNRLWTLFTTSYVTKQQHEQAINVIYNIIRYKITTWTGYKRYFQHHTLQNNNMNRLWTLFTTSYVTILQHEQAI